MFRNRINANTLTNIQNVTEAQVSEVQNKFTHFLFMVDT